MRMKVKPNDRPTPSFQLQSVPGAQPVEGGAGEGDVLGAGIVLEAGLGIEVVVTNDVMTAGGRLIEPLDKILEEDGVSVKEDFAASFEVSVGFDWSSELVFVAADD